MLKAMSSAMRSGDIAARLDILHCMAASIDPLSPRSMQLNKNKEVQQLISGLAWMMENEPDAAIRDAAHRLLFSIYRKTPSEILENLHGAWYDGSDEEEIYVKRYEKDFAGDFVKAINATIDESRATYLKDVFARMTPPPESASTPSLPERPQGSGVHAKYAAAVDQLLSESHDYRMQLAAKLAPVLNEKIQAMGHATYEKKKELANWVNDQLEPLGLAVQEPKTGLPAKFRAQAGNWPGVGRFAFEVTSDGKRKTPTVSDTLPVLTLTDSNPAKNTEISWQESVGTKASRTGRLVE